LCRKAWWFTKNPQSLIRWHIEIEKHIYYIIWYYEIRLYIDSFVWSTNTVNLGAMCVCIFVSLSPTLLTNVTVFVFRRHQWTFNTFGSWRITSVSFFMARISLQKYIGPFYKKKKKKKKKILNLKLSQIKLYFCLKKALGWN